MSERQKKAEENMAEVQRLMEEAAKVNAGSKLKEGIAIDFLSVDGNRYKGTVIFKRPGVMDFMKMGAIKSEIFREAGVVELSLVDQSVKMMAHVIANLKVVIAKSSIEDLLKIDECREPELLYHVYGKYEEWEYSFRKDTGTGESEENSATT